MSDVSTPDVLVGETLDNVGALYGVTREPGEPDAAYRGRITEVIPRWLRPTRAPSPAGRVHVDRTDLRKLIEHAIAGHNQKPGCPDPECIQCKLQAEEGREIVALAERYGYRVEPLRMRWSSRSPGPSEHDDYRQLFMTDVPRGGRP